MRAYRTPYLHPLLSHNELILKKKGCSWLSTLSRIRKKSRVPQTGELSNLLLQFAQLYAI